MTVSPIIGGTLLVLSAVGSVWQLSHHGTSSTTTTAAVMAPPEIPPHGTAQSPAEISEAIRATVRHYLQAPTLEDRLAVARRPKAVRFLMLDYHQRHPYQSLRPSGVKVVAKLDAITRTHPLYLAAATYPDTRTIPLVIEARNGKYRVDWESHVGYSPMDLGAFMETPPGSTMWFRLFATPDPEATQYQLTFPNETTSLAARIDRFHPQFQTLARHTKGAIRTPMILTLRRTLSAQLVDIAALKQVGWFIEDREISYADAWVPEARLDGDF